MPFPEPLMSIVRPEMVADSIDVPSLLSIETFPLPVERVVPRPTVVILDVG